MVAESGSDRSTILMENLPEEFLLGVALFNEGKFFECHEVWEAVWLKAQGAEREFLHAMIQTAAALHHVQRENLKGARSVGARAVGKLETMPKIIMQLDTVRFRASLESFLTKADDSFPRIELQDDNP